MQMSKVFPRHFRRRIAFARYRKPWSAIAWWRFLHKAEVRSMEHLRAYVKFAGSLQTIPPYFRILWVVDSSPYHHFPRPGNRAVITSNTVRMLMTIVVDQAITLKNLLLVYFPISFLLLTRMSMNISTNGSKDPFIT